MIKAASMRALRKSAAMPLVVVLTACGTPPPQDYGGSWTPVNRFQDAPSEIPLSPAYTFYATPIDETLKTMLERWATESGLKLSYRLDFDYTLYKRVTRIRTADIQAATSELSAIYAAQGVSVTADETRILVQSIHDLRTAQAPTTQTAAP